MRRLLSRGKRSSLSAVRILPQHMDPLDYYAHRVGLIPMGETLDERSIPFPDRFSFIEAPDEAIPIFERLVRFSLAGRTRWIVIEQEQCKLIDHGAESVAAALAKQATGWPRVSFRGTFPESKQQREIVLATGLPKYLGIPLPEPEGFLKFPLTKNRWEPSTPEQSTQNEDQATRFTQHVNNCLARYGSELTITARHHLTALVAEVLDNAERHSGRREWWIAGYLRHKSEQEYGDCHITLFNLGRTLAESLQEDLPEDAILRRDIEKLVAQHRRRGFLTRTWEPENLWTLYALQEGVSRQNVGREHLGGTMGHGTVQLIQFFDRIGQSSAAMVTPKMCIVSGRTQILFDGTYQMKHQDTPRGGKAYIIAFNEQNDLQRPPNPEHVRNLRHYFPGTVISMRFFLDSAHLGKLRRAE